MTANILLVERDVASADLLAPCLEKKGHCVSIACDEREAAQQASVVQPDLIILNAVSPQLDGPKACRTLRQELKGIPIILILAEGEKAKGPVEADVCLNRPFTSRKLLNRVRRLLSRKKGKILQAGDLTLNLETCCVTKGKREYKLTPKECKLLEIFMRNPGKVLSRKFLMRRVWNTDYLDDTRTLDVHVCWLRRKIEDNRNYPVYLRTVRGVGYRFQAPKED